ncbi:GGDEF domain-containing protein [Rhodovulum sp. MB263]|uniref:GGDEF domain-containing protein n=1 Tax=Rhodovulum sp. (strain MB263) TaxID=308754 RepID=UPI0009B742F4|nr:GGDEF domain-containing protein [Rhodovulum sp. MB263]ARC89110.1 hypothetical protein B5V46_11065 [Rhodovulum sp. MB263]
MTHLSDRPGGDEGVGCDAGPGLSGAALDRLMPMHVWIGAGGEVLRAGPTLQRLAGAPLLPCAWTEIVTLRRPRAARRLDDLLQMQGVALKFTLNARPEIALKGLVVPLSGGAALLNLSLGISLVDAVGRFDLTSSDFAPTDLAIELLYLNEAKTAVVGELRRLALRLNGARVSAEVEAATDTLTGLANRRAFDDALSRLVASDLPFALMQVDLDLFKAVNDSHGHGVGDGVLRIVAAVLRSHFRSRDVVARIGGDEFVVLMVDFGDRDHLLAHASRLIERIEQPMSLQGVECRISASIGIALATVSRRPSSDVLLQEADIALYDSKRRGRGRVTFYDQWQQRRRAPGDDAF